MGVGSNPTSDILFYAVAEVCIIKLAIPHDCDMELNCGTHLRNRFNIFSKMVPYFKTDLKIVLISIRPILFRHPNRGFDMMQISDGRVINCRTMLKLQDQNLG